MLPPIFGNGGDTYRKRVKVCLEGESEPVDLEGWFGERAVRRRCGRSDGSDGDVGRG